MGAHVSFSLPWSPPRYLIPPLFFFLFSFYWVTPLPCLSTGAGAHPPTPGQGHPGECVCVRVWLNLINLNDYLLWSLPSGLCTPGEGGLVAPGLIGVTLPSHGGVELCLPLATRGTLPSVPSMGLRG